jgi:hypothetical protein
LFPSLASAGRNPSLVTKRIFLERIRNLKESTMKKAELEKEPKSATMPDLNSKPSHTKPLSGSNHEQFSMILANQVASSLWTAHSAEKNKQIQIASCLEAMVGISPQEGMLVAQMVACHNAAMECFRRAMLKEQPHAGRQQNLSFAYKLSRTYALAMEALDKHRGKGQQKVTVEHVHVHVHQGGQAIVGNVQTGVGLQPKLEEQPDAKTITHAPEHEMRSAFEAVGETLPPTAR